MVRHVPEGEPSVPIERSVFVRKRVYYMTPEEVTAIDACRANGSRWKMLPEELLLRTQRAGLVLDFQKGDRSLFVDADDRVIVPIPSRPIKRVSLAMLHVIHAIVAGEFTFPPSGLYAVLGAWASERLGGSMTPESARVRLMGFRPAEPSQGWGVIYQVRNAEGKTVEYAIAAPGFTAYDFVVREEDDVELTESRKTELPALVIEDEEERDTLRALWKKRRDDAAVEIMRLEQELSDSEARIASLESSIAKTV